MTYGGDGETVDALSGSVLASELSAVGGVESGLPWMTLSVGGRPVERSTSIVPSQKLPNRCRWRGDCGPNGTSGGFKLGIAVRAFRNGSVSSCSGDGKASGAMLTRAAAQRIAAAVVVASACGTTGTAVNVGSAPSIGRASVDDRTSAKEPRRRWGIDDAMLIVEVRRDVDGPHISEDDPEAEGDCVGVDDPVEGGLVVWGGVSLFRNKGADASDGACGKGAPREAPVDNAFETVPAFPDREVENV